MINDPIYRNQIFHYLRCLSITRATLVIDEVAYTFTDISTNEEYKYYIENETDEIFYGVYAADKNSNDCPVCGKPIINWINENECDVVNENNITLNEFICDNCNFKGMQFSQTIHFGFVPINSEESIEVLKKKYNSI